MDTTPQDLVTRLDREADILARHNRGTSAAVDVMREAAAALAAARIDAHELALARAAAGQRGMTDCSTPLPQQIANMAKAWDAAAPPADLVALVLDMREALEAIASPGATTDYGWWTETARRVLRAHPLPAWRPSAPPAPAALPCGCARGHCEASTPVDCAVIQASAREAL